MRITPPTKEQLEVEWATLRRLQDHCREAISHRDELLTALEVCRDALQKIRESGGYQESAEIVAENAIANANKLKEFPVLEYGIPIPEARSGTPVRDTLKLKLSSMNIGESVFFEDIRRGYSARSVAHKLDGKKFVCRKMDRGIRIWRTE